MTTRGRPEGARVAGASRFRDMSAEARSFSTKVCFGAGIVPFFVSELVEGGVGLTCKVF